MEIMNSTFAPSRRALANLNQGPAWDLMQKVKQLPRYDPHDRPDGIINLSGAINNLMMDWLAAFTKDDLKFTSEALSYGPLHGSPALLEAASGFFNRFFKPQSTVSPENVLAANGVTSLINMMAWTLCDEGDGVMYFTPNFYMLDFNLNVRNKVRTIAISTTDLKDPTESSGLVEVLNDAWERNKNVRCRMLFLCNPTNPQGQCYPQSTLESLSSWCAQRQVHLVVDEIYAMSTFGFDAKECTPFFSILGLPLRDHHHCLYSLSKDFNMGGVRISFLVTRNALVRESASKLTWFTWLPVVSDTFATRFLSRLHTVEEYLDIYRRRLEAAYVSVSAALARHKISFQPASAGLFVFIDLSRWVHFFQDSPPLVAQIPEMPEALSAELQLCNWLIQHGVFLNAGEFAGCNRPGHFRLVFTQNPDAVEVAVARIRTALDRLERSSDQIYSLPHQRHYACQNYHYQLSDESRTEAARPCSTVSIISDVSDGDWSTVHVDSSRGKSHPQNIVGYGEHQDHEDQEEELCILARCLIPGRGEPLHNVAVGVSVTKGIITFVGPQSQIPASLASAPHVSVGYLMPGLWDCHTHFTGTIIVDFPDMVLTHPATMGAAVTRGLHDTLMAGITSVRDVGSYATEIAPLVAKGIILGPNIFGAGGAIGISGGSCDACTLPADYVYSRQGVSGSNPWPGVSCLVLADGVDECRLAVRQQIRRGARCIKVVATGGILSTTDNPEYRQYSDAELAALIDEASLQNRSVAVHAHGKAGIMAAVRAGAHTIEHGSYIDEEAAELMAVRKVTLVSTRHVVEAGLRNLDKLNPETAVKMVDVAEKHMRAYKTAVRKGVKIALGTDIAASDPTSDTAHGNNGHEIAYAVEAGLTPLQAIDAGTINSAETLGGLAPKKGLVRVGWDADLIALDENPLENIKIFGQPENITYVWKGGLLVKSPTGKLMWPPLPKAKSR